MYQNALIANDPSVTLSSSSSMLRAHSLGYSPRYTPFRTASTGICLNAVYPKWMYSPPIIKHRKPKPKRDFITENKLLAANPNFIAQLPLAAHEAVDASESADAARAAYENFIKTMRGRDDGPLRKIRCRWSGYSPDACALETDSAERQLLEFASRVPGDAPPTVENISGSGSGDTSGEGSPCAEADLQLPSLEQEQTAAADASNQEEQKTFIDELLEDVAFIDDIAHAKDRVDSRLNPAQANPNLAPSPFGQPVTNEPTFRYEKGTTGEVLVLIHPENLYAPTDDSKFLYTEEELKRIAATSMYGNYILRRQEDLYKAPYLIPYTFRSSRI